MAPLINVDNWRHKSCLFGRRLGGYQGKELGYTYIYIYIHTYIYCIYINSSTPQHLMLARTQPNVVCANTTDLVVIWLNPGARTLHSGWCEILSCADSCHFLPALSSCRFNFTTSAKLLFICNVSQKCRLMNETILGVEHSWANPQSPVPNKVSYNVLQLVVWKHPNVATENSSRETQQRAYWRLRKTATQDCRRANDVIEIAVFLKLQFSKYLYIYIYICIYIYVCVWK